jgi:O-acetyl-ADP-ribose deacetylase (regulator of RNase III)
LIIYEGPGNLFGCRMQTIACSINTVGAMGKGIAVKFRDHVPGLYDFYREIYCDKPPHYPSVNRLEMFHVDAGRSVLLLPTKDHWRYPSKIRLIDENLKQLAERYKELGITSLGLPAIGCGHDTGQLSWEQQVGPLVRQYLDPLPIPVKVFLN